jgi:hypothetical protein
MESAKYIAKDMLKAIHIERSGFLEGMAKEFISFPTYAGFLIFRYGSERMYNEFDTYR